jgi:hypothetical protein
MAELAVDGTTRQGVLMLRLVGAPSPEEMQQFVRLHNQAVDAFRDKHYRVFCDIRELLPLSPEAADLFEQAKAYSASRPNFQGSSVLTSSSVVAMQHRRTSMNSGVLSTELLSDDEAACWAHLARIQRSR